MPVLLSIIVPIRNEEACIARTLEGVLNQDFPADQFEVLVVDGESTDRTVEIVEAIAKTHPNVRCFTNPRHWSSAARNIGVREAAGTFVIIIDGHCELRDPHYLRNVIDAFEESGADCLGRPQPLDVSQANSLQKAIAIARQSRLGHHPDSFIYSNEPRFVPAHSVAVAYRRDVFQKIGLFDERFDACEDVELNHRIDRAGLKCYLTPRILVRYEPRSTLRGLFKQLVRYGRGRIRLLRKHPDTFSLKTLMPTLFYAGVVLGPFVAILSAWLGWFYLSVVALYLMAILGVSLAGWRTARDWRIAAWLPVVLIVIHLASAAGQTLELFSSRLTPLPNAPA